LDLSHSHDEDHLDDHRIPIHWKSFLDHYVAKDKSSSKSVSYDPHEEDIVALCNNHRMLLTVFKFFDANGSGTIDQDEFEKGIAILNRRLPTEWQLSDPVKLFGKLDIDGNGTISIDEFEQVFGVL
jgi:hypothetical protein